MTEEQMKRRLYDRYQLQWMLSHGYSLQDIMKGMDSIPEYHDAHIQTRYVEIEPDSPHEIADVIPDGMQADISGIFADWEYEFGFPGRSIWACFDEFCDIELLDKEYMLWLLDEVGKDDDDLRDTYLEWLEDNGEEDEE